MRKFKAKILLLVLGFSLFPWQFICLAHPLGHDHHDKDEISPCEISKKIMQQPGEHLLPPMECEHISTYTDNFNQTDTEKITPSLQIIATTVVIFNLVNFENPPQIFLLPPEPCCRSATLLSDSPLRAPPLV